jgi:hypothetical protein
MPDAKAGSAYLFYENRSRLDGLEGPFGKIKRGMVENKAIDGLKSVLEQSKLKLDARGLRRPEAASVSYIGQRWGGWLVRASHLFLWVFLITVFIALLARARNRRVGSTDAPLRLTNRSIIES